MNTPNSSLTTTFEPVSADTSPMPMFEPGQSGISLPRPPTFQSSQDERQHRKQQLAGAFRIFGRLGFGEGVTGHITVRDPEYPDMFWVNPFGMSFKQIRVSDLILVDHEGHVRHGSRPVNAAGFTIHSAIHETNPDVVAACHAHSVHGKAWSSLGRRLDPITQDACALHGNHVVVEEGAGAVVLDREVGRILGTSLIGNRMAIHRNHGIFTVGESVAEAAWWFITTERNCQAQLLAEAAGTPVLIDEENAMFTREQTGSPYAGWFSFQPLWDEVVDAEPELLD